MFDALIVKDYKETYIKIKNNKIEGFTLLDGNISNLLSEDIKILNMFKMGKNSVLTRKEKDYQIYYDKDSSFFHFFKDGKEDVLLFCLYNGKVSYLAKKDKRKSIYYHPEYKFILEKLKCTIYLKTSLLLNILTASISLTSTALISYYYDTPIGSISREFIQNEYLSKEDKNLLHNKKLISDILPYYEGTNMNVYIHSIIPNLQIKYESEKISEDSVGWVYSLNPEVIHILDCEHNNNEKNLIDTKTHEFIHVLQSIYIKTNYSLICEASAELISCEYFDTEINSYYDSIKILKSLMEVVGPEVIWKLNFSSEDELKSIIMQNMDENDAIKLLNLLNTNINTLSNEEKQQIIFDLDILISRLNIMLKNSSNTNNMLDYSAIMKDRYYFNSDKIEELNPYIINYNVSYEYEIESKVVHKIYRKYTYQEYLEFKEKGFSLKLETKYGAIYSDKVVSFQNGKEYSYEEAIEKVFLIIRDENPIEIVEVYNDNTDEYESVFDKLIKKYNVDSYMMESENFALYEGKWYSYKDPYIQDYLNNAFKWTEVKKYFPNIYECFPDQRISTYKLFNL